MNSKKIKFKNKDGVELSAIIDYPANQHPHSFALFAHCFTCSKNFNVVNNISKSLTRNGIAVMRFDFTGLGQSEGEFSDSTFSSNIDDLVAAASFLDKNHEAPSLLVGHSLGGAAVIFAANEIESVKAVATIAAPSSPDHVTNLLVGEIDEIKEQGEANVSIGGREFKIKKKFLEDIEKKKMDSVLDKYKDKALLILHSPQDNIVGIKNAEDIYKSASHPKSFISLDGADHLLSEEKDSLYTGEVISSWIKRYIDFPEEKKHKTDHDVVAIIDGSGYTTEIQAGNHTLVSDEPIDVGGNDFGPTPYELLSSGLGACTAITLQMYAKRKKWNLTAVKVHLKHDKKHAEDCDDCKKSSSKVDVFERAIALEGDLDEKQKKRLIEIANKCPVHRTLHENEVKVETSLFEG